MNNHLEEGLVFLTDLGSFSRLTKGMDLLQLAEMLTDYAKITDRVISGAGGTIVKYESDSVLGYFPKDLADTGVRALMDLKKAVESELKVTNVSARLKIGAHYGEFAVAYFPPVNTLDIIGDTVNIAIRMGSGGPNPHPNRLVLSAEAFRKLEPETRKAFHKFTEPIVYLMEE